MGDFDKGMRDMYGGLRKIVGEHLTGYDDKEEIIKDMDAMFRGNDEMTGPEEEEMEVHNQEGIETIRETFEWGTFGKAGLDPMQRIVLKDISDSHLVHIIGHLITTNRAEVLITMLEEARYRSENNIFVPDYEE